jgi:hypothetical protein
LYEYHPPDLDVPQRLTSDKQSTYQSSSPRFSFGSSRSVGIKYHTFRIFQEAEKGNTAPGPGRYTLKTPKGLEFSIKPRRVDLQNKFNRNPNVGPGTYAPKSLAGLDATTPAQSIHRSVESYRFSKAIKPALVEPLIGTEPGPTSPVPDFVSPRI